MTRYRVFSLRRDAQGRLSVLWWRTDWQVGWSADDHHAGNLTAQQAEHIVDDWSTNSSYIAVRKIPVAAID